MRARPRRRDLARAALLAAAALLPLAAHAQYNPIEPPGLLFPNSDRVLVGEVEALEGGAYVARARGPAANWYNPAGLALTPTTTASLSTGGWEYQSLTAGGFRTSDGSQSITTRPSFAGIVFGPPIVDWDDLRLGVSVTNFTAIRPSLDAQATRTVATGQETVGYATQSVLLAYRLAVGAGWRLSDAWRVGASVNGNYLSMQRDEAVTDRLDASVPGAPPSLALQSQTVNAHGVNVGLSLGAQWQPVPWLSVGALVITPGLHLLGGAAVSYSSQTLYGDGTTVTSDLRDKQASFHYATPWQVNLGMAVTGTWGAAELDVRYHAAQSTYAVASTSQLLRFTVVYPDRTFAEAWVQPPAYLAASRTVVNVAAGGRIVLGPTVTLHGGFFTDLSPVAPSDDQIFQAVDLYGATGGVSFQWKNFSGSVGGAYTWGHSQELQFLGLLGGTAPLGAIDARIVSLLFAISYRA